MKPDGRVVVARSREGNEDLLRELSKRGVEATGVETIRLEDPDSWRGVDDAVTDIGSFDWVAFTSSRGVAAFQERLRALGIVAKGLKTKFAAVGPGTASALREMGIRAAYVPKKFLTSAMGEGLPIDAGSRVLLLRADIGDRKLVLQLEGRGCTVVDVAAYHTRFVDGPVPSAVVESAQVVAFASPSEVEGLRRRLDGEEFRELAARATAACIGPVTARAAKEAGFGSVGYAGEHTIDGLADKIVEMMVHA